MIVCLTIILTKNEVIFLDIFDNVKHNWKLKRIKEFEGKRTYKKRYFCRIYICTKRYGAAAGAGSFLEVIINNLSNIMFQVF